MDTIDAKSMSKPCKHGDLACGDGRWYCGKCANEMNRAAYSRLTPAEKTYDNFVDPLGAYHSDYDREPRNYCMSNGDNE